MFSKPLKLLYLSLIVVLLATTLPACSTAEKTAGLHMMDLKKMPVDVQSAPVTVHTAYQFAAANPEILENIPCYCGCGNVGHLSNYDCYVASVDADGGITFDTHALGCSICVDITQDVMRMLQEGKSAEEARVYVDIAYSRYGPSNLP
jgi:hypothetical protein